MSFFKKCGAEFYTPPPPHPYKYPSRCGGCIKGGGRIKFLPRGGSEYTPPPPSPEKCLWARNGGGGGGGVYNFSLEKGNCTPSRFALFIGCKDKVLINKKTYRLICEDTTFLHTNASLLLTIELTLRWCLGAVHSRLELCASYVPQKGEAEGICRDISLFLVTGGILFREYCFGEENSLSSAANSVSSARNSVSSLLHTNNRPKGTR